MSDGASHSGGARASGSRRGAVDNTTTWATLYPALVMAYACLLPTELKIVIGTITLFPYRIALFLMLPAVVSRVWRGTVRLSGIDIGLILLSVWVSLSILVVNGIEALLESGLNQTFDISIGYLVARTSIRSPAALASFLRKWMPGLVCVAALLASESLSGRLILRPMLARLFSPGEEIIPAYRLGFLRAYGPFSHPIHAGMFFASIIPLAWFVLPKGKIRNIGLLCGLAALFSLSSAPILAVLITFSLIAYRKMIQAFRWMSWNMLLVAIAFLGVFIEIFSPSGLFSFIIRRLTLDAGTGAYRMLIWEYGTAEVWRHPLFGIGLNDWVRPDWMVSSTIDAHWLVFAMKHGLLMGVGMLMIAILLIRRVARSGRAQGASVEATGMGVAISLSVMTLMAFTVYYWGAMAIWYLMLLGVASSLVAHGEKNRRRRPPPNVMKVTSVNRADS